IVHMRQQLRTKRFGLVLGAGVGKPFGLPNWRELLRRIAEDPQVNGVEVFWSLENKSPQESLAQMLFEHFRAGYCAKNGREETDILELERDVKRIWREIIHKNLYRDVPDNLEGRHPYLEEYLNIVRQSTMTVNYNFDDTIERMLAAGRTEQERRRGLGYETVWDATLQFRLNEGVIYHPNGFLPKNLLEGPSEDLIFSEDSFADQLIASMTGHYVTLLHHFLKNTCLFIGVSLEDPTLRHLLRQNARINPGHYHYHVAFVKDATPIGPLQRRAITASNFETYNLITLFLNSQEIRALGRLINSNPQDMANFAEEIGLDLKFCFYITGVPGASKSTVSSFFRSLATFAEWPNPRLELLAKPFTELTASERETVDSWVADQFGTKNRNLLTETEGIHVIDRCPLDPLTFTPDGEWPGKAARLHRAISPGRSKRKIQAGHVILLRGDEKVMAARLRVGHKRGSPEYLAELHKSFQKIYSRPGTTELDTRGLSIHEVVKRVAHIIHMQDYQEADLHGILLKTKDTNTVSSKLS
ncbi:MAG: SIR2 family protein, partial [Anaerolineae bacterium]